MLERITNTQRARILTSGLLAIGGPSVGLHEYAEYANGQQLKNQVTATQCLQEMGATALITEQTAAPSCQKTIETIRVAQAATKQDDAAPLAAGDITYFANLTIDRDMTNPDTAAQMGAIAGASLWLTIQYLLVLPGYVQKNQNNSRT